MPVITESRGSRVNVAIVGFEFRCAGFEAPYIVDGLSFAVGGFAQSEAEGTGAFDTLHDKAGVETAILCQLKKHIFVARMVVADDHVVLAWTREKLLGFLRCRPGRPFSNMRTEFPGSVSLW